MSFKVEVIVTQKKNTLNPENGVIQRCANENLKFKIEELDSGKYFRYKSYQPTPELARSEACDLADKLLANTVVQEYEIRVLPYTNL